MKIYLFFVSVVLAMVLGQTEIVKQKSCKPENISWISDDHTEVINFKALERTFLHLEVKNRKLFVITVAGPQYAGKSSLLDYILKFLYENVSCKLGFFYF